MMTRKQREVARVTIFWRYPAAPRTRRQRPGIKQTHCWGHQVAGAINSIRKIGGEPMYLIRYLAIVERIVDGEPTKFWRNDATGGLMPLHPPRPSGPAGAWFRD